MQTINTSPRQKGWMESGRQAQIPQVLSATLLSPFSYVNEDKKKKKKSQMDIGLEDTKG